MADKFGNYVAAFFMAGSIAIVASFIPFILRCVERKGNSDNHVAYLEELMDKDENVPETCSRSRGKDPSKITYHIELESRNPVRTTAARISSKRPISYMCAIERPFSPITLDRNNLKLNIIPNFTFKNIRKQTAPLESAAKELLFEWSHT